MRTLVAPVATTPLRPVDAAGERVTGGFWATRLATNRERSIPHGRAQLEASGALGNFRHAARGSGRYVGGLDDAGITFPFLDSDVYKWLEAVGWELGRAPDAAMSESADDVVATVEAAQRPDGYLNTFVQLSGREPYSDLQWGHELYCVGHLVQAAIAWQRSLDDGRLLVVAERALHHIEGALGEAGREAVEGHPEIEMALVELFRTTGQDRYLRFAALLVERRGRGLLGPGRLGARYWQDHAPVREAPTMTGHAVRQLYLDCGVVDVAVETADRELLEAVVRRWDEMWATRTYLTGALGSRHRDEAFGDPYELPGDRAYAETCAAIASVMLSWRLLLATGEARFADALERTLYNAVLPGVGLDGTSFFYTNPLHRRASLEVSGNATGSRRPWYPCACCPPNLMRTLSSFEHLLATTDGGGIGVAQWADATLEAPVMGGRARLAVTTGYPWDGRIDVVIQDAPGTPWALDLRIPAWASGLSIHAADGERESLSAAGWHRIARTWAAGDRVVLDLPMAPRMTQPDPRIDAERGSVAIERGPLVYCLEQADLPSGASVDELSVVASPSALGVIELEGALSGIVGVRADVTTRATPVPGWPYHDIANGDPDGPDGRSIAITSIPYLAWANREPGAMRVWIPRSGPAPEGSGDPA
jgi:DUF1680 family protein